MSKVFDALASDTRRTILSYLSDDDLTAGEISSRFDMSKPAISKHLQILENAGLVTSDKRGQFVWYALSRDHLEATIILFLKTVGSSRIEVPVTKASLAPGSSRTGDLPSPDCLDRPQIPT